MSSKIVLSFYFVFAVFCLQVKGQYSFSELDSISDSNPKEIIDFLKTNESDQLSELEKNYLYSKSSESLGLYQKVDSSINYALKNLSFPKDSNLYFELIKVLIDQKKITDDFEFSLKLLYELLAFSEKRKDTLKIISLQ